MEHAAHAPASWSAPEQGQRLSRELRQPSATVGASRVQAAIGRRAAPRSCDAAFLVRSLVTCSVVASTTQGCQGKRHEQPTRLSPKVLAEHTAKDRGVTSTRKCRNYDISGAQTQVDVIIVAFTSPPAVAVDVQASAHQPHHTTAPQAGCVAPLFVESLGEQGSRQLNSATAEWMRHQRTPSVNA
ncbi:hypothetical protein GQ42DRAFT_164112 [Ramicandelaber brevisporus]|nr:hypothetical protein GQ42DRAFT_164112 [Ramicandelaber brevisporus]